MDHAERPSDKSSDWLVALRAWARYDDVLSNMHLAGALDDLVVQAALSDLYRQAIKLTEDAGVGTSSGRLLGIASEHTETLAAA
jgi:hypothetical protein